MVQSTLAFMRAALKTHHSKQYLQIWKLRNANGWHTMDSNLIQDNGTCFIGNLEPFDYLDAYDDNTKLRDDWKHIVSHLQRRKFMITIFNRKELFITYDMQKQNEICSLLKIHGIDYDVKVLNTRSSSPVRSGFRTYTGTLGENLSKSYEYKIYVKKGEYEKAQALMYRK